MPDPFTNEDRARLRRLRNQVSNPPVHRSRGHPAWKEDGAALDRALAHIDHLEKALEAADELADSITDEVLSGEAPWTRVLQAALAYRSARASTKGDAG